MEGPPPSALRRALTKANLPVSWARRARDLIGYAAQAVA